MTGNFVYGIRNVNGVYTVGAVTSVGLLPIYATADWDALTGFVKQIAESYINMAKARGESMPDAITKAFPERI